MEGSYMYNYMYMYTCKCVYKLFVIYTGQYLQVCETQEAILRRYMYMWIVTVYMHMTSWLF